MNTNTLRRWVKDRGLEGLGFELKLANLTKPDHMHDRQKVVDALAGAVRLGRPITLFGDYDCDGMGATIILTEVLRELGGRVTPVLASRFSTTPGMSAGYGLSDEACERILKTKPSLLVTLDCGSSNHTQIRYLQAKGIEVHILDHHLVPSEPLPAESFINPHKPECDFEFKDLCSAGLALSIAAGVRTTIGATINIAYWLDICAISTIADVMPLVKDNRILVANGLEYIRKAQRPGMRALCKIAKIDSKFAISGRDVAFRLSPLLNAPGRLGSPDIILRLLMTKDHDEAEQLANELEHIAARRRDLSKQLEEEAEYMIQQKGWQNRSALALGDEEWGHGLVGITAGRLSEKYKVPVCVFGSEGKGSVRGPQGSQLHTMLTACSDLLVKFGGHQAAAGAEVDYARLEAFRAAWEQAAIQHPAQPTSNADLTLKVDPRDNFRAILSDLQQLEPCGEGNPRPVLEIQGRVTQAKDVKTHLSLELQVGGQRLKCFKVAEGHRVEELLNKNVVIRGDLKPTTFGSAGVECFCDSISVV